MSLNLSSKTITLQANAVLPVAVTGSMFFCRTSDAAFKLSFDGGEEVDLDQGVLVDLAASPIQIGSQTLNSFRNLIFRNPTGLAINITFLTGTEAIKYYPPLQIISLLMQAASTYAKGSGLVALGAGLDTAAFTGLDGTKRRKQIVVWNDDANLPLLIKGGDGSVMGKVPAGQSWTLETSGSIKVNNPNGLAVNYIVGETFYS